MVWGAISSQGVLELQFPSTKMNSNEYISVLNGSLLNFLRQNRKKKFVFQQDNARIHVSRETKAWMASMKIEVLDWPACSPDLNPMENVWAILVRRVYENNRQFETIAELKQKILHEWDNLQMGVIENLYSSMNNRIFEVIQRNGGKTHY